MACTDVDVLISRALDQITVLRICTGYRCSVPPDMKCARCPELAKEVLSAAKKLISIARELESLLSAKEP